MLNDITIGIPVYNEERHIELAIRSAARQCKTLLISDNASTDNTPDICQKLCREFPNIRYIRQPRNIGALENFEFLLAQAVTSHFMWLGGDDMIPDGYVERLQSALHSSPDATLAYGAARHIDLEGEDAGVYDYHYHQLLASQDAFIRLQGIIQHLGYCSLFHGVFRIGALKEAWEHGIYLGIDKVILTKAVLKGRFVYAPDTYLFRRNAHPEGSLEAQLQRISGESTGKDHTYQEMQSALYSLTARATSQTGITGIYIRLRTRLVLISRYGPFGDNIVERTTARIAHRFLMVAKHVKRRCTTWAHAYRRARSR